MDEAKALSYSFWQRNCADLDAEAVKDYSLDAIKTFKLCKRVVWQCSLSFDESGEEIPKEERNVDFELLIKLMDEIQLMLDLHRAGMTRGLTVKKILKRFSVMSPLTAEK